MPKLIALDAGHGMNTAGKRTPPIPSLGGRVIRENEFNHAVVGFLKTELERCGFKTLITSPFPQEDRALYERTRLANTLKADAFISIHYNAMDGKFDGAGKDPEGLGLYIYKGSVKSRKLAESIMKFLPNGTVQKNQGIREANFHVLRETKMVAVLSENGFMDNEKEAVLMINPSFQKEVAREHAMGICDYFGVKYVPEVSVMKYRLVVGEFATTTDAQLSQAILKAKGFSSRIEEIK
jgi:N-acetylmuramoyl-L-alanine amidase